MIPISPLSIVKVISDHPGWKDVFGRTFRVGYYSPQDGLECVWLVDELGKYVRTAEQQDILEDFEILHRSGETDLFGVDRPVIGPI
jgi:hypothetical protein